MSLENELHILSVSKSTPRSFSQRMMTPSKTSLRTAPSGRIWSLDQVQTKVEFAVRKVVSVPDNERLDDKISLMDMGMDSLGSTELAATLQTEFDVELPSTMVFNYPTIEDLSSYLHDILKPQQESNITLSTVWNLEHIQTEVESAVRRVISVSDDELLDDKMSLMDMGLDSLGSTELAATLQTTFDVELPSTLVFNYPTVTELSNYLHGILAPQQNLNSSISKPTNITALSQQETRASFSIVGMSCRFPGGASSLLEYWNLLCDESQTSSYVPFGRWDVFSLAASSKLNEKEKMQLMHGSFVDDMEYFEPSVFGISKAEAEFMSPSQRIILECSYLALRDAGFERNEINGLNCGVFVGGTNASSSTATDFRSVRPSVYSATGATVSIASGRVSYVFNFKGPNAAYDTACSSSLVALDAAISALSEGKCDMALVAGVNELFDSRLFVSFASAGMLSPTGRCHTFDVSADG